MIDGLDLLHRIDEEQDRLLALRTELYDKYSELRSGQSDLQGSINVNSERIQSIEFRVDALEDNFDMLRGRLWALVLIIISELLVAGFDLLMSQPVH